MNTDKSSPRDSSMMNSGYDTMYDTIRSSVVQDSNNNDTHDYDYCNNHNNTTLSTLFSILTGPTNETIFHSMENLKFKVFLSDFYTEAENRLYQMNPLAISRMNMCIETNLASAKADHGHGAKKLKQEKLKKEMDFDKIEETRLEAEIAKEKELIDLLQRNTKALLDKGKKEEERLRMERHRLIEEFQRTSTEDEIELLKAKIKSLSSSKESSVGIIIMKQCHVNPKTLKCAEGKSVVGQGSDPPECNIFNCPAISKKTNVQKL